MVNAHVWDTISRTATFCSLCGVFVDPWQDAFVVAPELSWLNEIRVGESHRGIYMPAIGNKMAGRGGREGGGGAATN